MKYQCINTSDLYRFSQQTNMDWRLYVPAGGGLVKGRYYEGDDQPQVSPLTGFLVVKLVGVSHLVHVERVVPVQGHDLLDFRQRLTKKDREHATV
jgi:hypothetical protein